MSARDPQDIYNDRDVVRIFDGALGWIDYGEEAAVLTVAPFVRGKRILDIGVGAGRTVGILSLLSDSYVGIDYSAEMVSACRKRYSDADIRWGDALDLSAFDDCSFDFVMFSFNGIDSLDDSGRRTALTEISRVLDDEAIFVFCTFNKNGQYFGETPFQLHRPGHVWDRRPKTVARFLWRNTTDPRRLVRRYGNWLKARHGSVETPGWAMKPISGLDFSLVNHFVTIDRLREELRAAKFEIVVIYEGSSTHLRAIPPGSSESDTDWFHVVARKAEV
jgi:ubiquinone/menaquinone biosynthesis C-methylase UbiE